MHAESYINNLCEDFSNGRIIGSMCNPLCRSNKIFDINCQSIKYGNYFVLKAIWNRKQILLKTCDRVSPFHWYDNGELKYPTQNQFYSSLRAMIRSKLNLDLSYKDIISINRLYAKGTDLTQDKIGIDMASALMQNNEFLHFSVYSDKDVFPQILGTCGLTYAIEYLRPVHFTSAILSSGDITREEWSERLKIAIKIMDLLQEFDDSFHEPIYLCNMQLHHFGLTKDTAKVKYLNVDYIFPRSKLNEMILRNYCTEDEDCDYFNCRSKCHKNQCSQGVTNNNVQIVCEKIFLGWASKNIIVPGLLMSDYTPTELAIILRQCSNPIQSEEKARVGADNTIKKKLYDVLIEIESSLITQRTV